MEILQTLVQLQGEAATRRLEKDKDVGIIIIMIARPAGYL